MHRGASSFKNAMEIGAEVYHTLKSVIKKKYGQETLHALLPDPVLLKLLSTFLYH